MEKITDRLSKYMAYKGLNPNKITVEAGISVGLIGRSLKNQTGFNSETIEKILHTYPDLNPVWFVLGKGEMIISDIYIVSEPGEAYEARGGGEMEIVDDSQEPETFENKSGNKFMIYPDGRYTVEVLEVPFPAYASYLQAYTDEKLLVQEFGKTTFDVDKIGLGNYMGFRVKGDSMNGGGINDTPHGAKVLGREVGRHLWELGFRKTLYGFVLLTKNNIYHKDITDYNKETGMLTLHSRNPKVDDFEISINDVYQVFNVIKRAY